MIWIIGMGLVFALCIVGLFYMSGAVSRFAPIRKAAGERKGLGRLLAFGLLSLGFAAFVLCLGLMDAVVILLHLLIFFLLFGLLFRLFRKGREGKVFWQGHLALLCTVLYLAVGYYQCMHVWKTEYTLQTDKPVGTLKIALISDSHLGTTFDGAGFAEYLDEILAEKPDLILIPGDFVDDSTGRGDLELACAALGRAETKYGVFFAYGNHDRGYYNSRDFSAEDLERCLAENGVHVLEDEAFSAGPLYLAGRADAGHHRLRLDLLLTDAAAEQYVIVLDHQPAAYEEESESAVDLVVSGHTHGGQLIPLGLIGEWFGGNDRTYGYERRNGTDFVVTSGISDWALHFKTGTRSEYVILTVEGSPAA